MAQQIVAHENTAAGIIKYPLPSLPVEMAGEYAEDISETVINLLVENEIAPSRAKIRK